MPISVSSRTYEVKLTVPPSADVEAVHHRMAAILAPEDRAVWLGEAEGDLAAVLKPWPAGRLTVREAG